MQIYQLGNLMKFISKPISYYKIVFFPVKINRLPGRITIEYTKLLHVP